MEEGKIQRTHSVHYKTYPAMLLFSEHITHPWPKLPSLKVGSFPNLTFVSLAPDTGLDNMEAA